MADDDSDPELFERWCAGDKVAGTALFRRHHTSIFRFFANKVEAADADDLVQETFLACVGGRDRFAGRSSVRTYLFAIARNVLLLHWRRRSRRGDALDVDEVSIASLSTSAGSRMARDQDRERVLAALRRLPIDQQVLVELHYWEGLDREQLAEVFEIAPATTGSRLFRARQALREHLAAGSDDAVDALTRSAAGGSGAD